MSHFHTETRLYLQHLDYLLEFHFAKEREGGAGASYLHLLPTTTTAVPAVGTIAVTNTAVARGACGGGSESLLR